MFAIHLFLSVVRASEVGARSAVITWRTPVVYHSYRVIYQVAGEEAKVGDDDPSLLAQGGDFPVT